MKRLIAISILITTIGCKSGMDKIIKEGYFDACKNHNVETLVKSFFANPEWVSFVSPDDNKYHLNASGQITYFGKVVNAVIQFEMEGEERWKINAFEINGQPQDDEMIIELISEMCTAASNKNGEITSNEQEVSELKEEIENIDGTYSDQNSFAEMEIVISGDQWFGKTVMITGFGSDYDAQNAVETTGVVKGNDLYDASGSVKIGTVDGNKITTSMAGQSVTLRK